MVLRETYRSRTQFHKLGQSDPRQRFIGIALEDLSNVHAVNQGENTFVLDNMVGWHYCFCFTFEEFNWDG